MHSAIVFDLDGVIIESHSSWERHMNISVQMKKKDRKI